MICCAGLFIGFGVIVLAVILIVYLYNQHVRISRLENRAAPHLTIIEREIHGIGFYMRIIVGIAIFFCIGVCVHYIAVFYPRFTTIKDHENYVSSIGADYWGIIVGFFTLLVTLLVGWQIFSTIKTRDELHDTRDNIERRMNDRIENFEKCCEERKEEIKSLQGELNGLKEQLQNTRQTIKDVEDLPVFTQILQGARQYKDDKKYEDAIRSYLYVLSRALPFSITFQALLEIDETLRENSINDNKLKESLLNALNRLKSNEEIVNFLYAKDIIDTIEKQLNKSTQ